ncbi:hypothetical protein [Crateriforma spongiae]|uniref:hypothetical protein n=1 Tax=Crateriforma spongiae TaxID=2724528 RepID=UPI001447BC9A|nr:hypothetical protein [Crateriforma spongiae]
MATTVVELTGDEAALLRSLDKIIAKEREHATQLAKVAEAGGDIGDEMKKGFDRFAKSSDDQLKGLLREVQRTSPEMGRSLKKHFQEAGKAGYRSIGEILDEIEKIDPAAAKAARTLGQGVEQSAERGEASIRRFSDTARDQIRAIAGAWLGGQGVEGAIQKVLEVQRKVLETNKEIFDGLKGSADGERRLLQVATSREDFQGLREAADRLATQYGVDRNEARNLVFAARSEGFEGSIDFIGANQQQLSVEAQAVVAGQVPTLFGGELTPEQAINATLAGAGQSKLAFEEVARGLPGASEGAALAGASTDETIATLAVLASSFKSGDTAADRIKAFATKVSLDQGGDDRESLQGRGILEAVRLLQSFTEDQRREFLGNSDELNVVYGVLTRQVDRIEQIQKQVQQAIQKTGTAESPTGLGRAITGSDERLAAVLREAQSKNELQVVREELRGASEGNRQAGVNDQLRFAESAGASWFGVAAAELASDAFAGVGASELSQSIIPTIASDPLANFRRDLGFAFDQYGGQTNEVSATLLAVNQLREQRGEDPNAVLSRDATANFIRTATGQLVGSGDVTPQQQKLLTRELLSAAGQSGQFERTLATSIPLFGNVARVDSAAQANDAADRIVEKLSELLEATKQTAKNTKPRRPDPAATMRQGASR